MIFNMFFEFFKPLFFGHKLVSPALAYQGIAVAIPFTLDKFRRARLHVSFFVRIPYRIPGHCPLLRFSYEISGTFFRSTNSENKNVGGLIR